MIIKVAQNQTIWDIALQYAGSVEAALDILQANSKAETTLFVGEELIVPKVINKRIATFFESETSIGTSIEPLGQDTWVQPPSSCLPAYYQLLFNGLLLNSGTIGSGQNQPIDVASLIPDADYTIIHNTLEIGSGSIIAGQDTPIDVTALVPNADYTIIHNGLEVANGSISPGISTPIEVTTDIPPAYYKLTNQGVSIEDGSIPAGALQNIEIDNFINQWFRPELWPAIPTTTNRAFIVWAVFNDAPINGIGLTINANILVSWGDGTSVTGSGTLNKSYTYGSITAPELMSYDGRTYKPVLIQIEVTSGNPTDFFIQNTTSNWANNALQVVDRLNNSTGRKRYRLSPTELTLSVTQFTNRSAIYVEGISLNHQLTQSNAALSGMRNCQLFDVPNNFFNLIFSVESLTHLFNRSFASGCVILGSTFFGGSSGNLSSLFQASNIYKIGDITTSVSSLLTSIFQDSDIEEIGNVTITNATSLNNAFQSCRNLKKLGLLSLPNLLTINNAFNGCGVPEIIFTSNLSSVTGATNAFVNNGNLRRLVLPGFRLGFDISRNRMQAATLTEMLMSLGNPTTPQNIIITGNPGSVGYNPPNIHQNWNIVN